MESPTGKPKKNKLSHLEFDFDGLPLEEEASATPGKRPVHSEEKREILPEMPFGKPISPHFEKESEKDLHSSPAPSPLLKGTAIGSFKAQSTAMPSKPISAPSSLGSQSLSKESVKEILRPTLKEPQKETLKDPLLTPLPPMETPMSSQIPSMSDFRRNAERQSKEQQATGSILSGIAYALLAVIIIVASLSAFGGYVMWRQIQNQATTVAQLSDKLNNEVAALREEAALTKKNSDEAFRRQQEVVNKLNLSLEQQRSTFLAEQKKKDREIQSLQGRLNRVESRFGVSR